LGQLAVEESISVTMADEPKKPEPEKQEKSQHDRAPYQKNEERNAVDSAEKTKEVPTKHGAIK
jgi:hypothetical protein